MTREAVCALPFSQTPRKSSRKTEAVRIGRIRLLKLVVVIGIAVNQVPDEPYQGQSGNDNESDDERKIHGRRGVQNGTTGRPRGESSAKALARADDGSMHAFRLRAQTLPRPGPADVIEMALHRHRADLEQERLVRELRRALARVKTLERLLPICMHCKRIRDDEGYWMTIDAYITKHTDVQFSHGICQVCLTERYSAWTID